MTVAITKKKKYKIQNCVFNFRAQSSCQKYCSTTAYQATAQIIVEIEFKIKKFRNHRVAFGIRISYLPTKYIYVPSLSGSTHKKPDRNVGKKENTNM